MAAGSPLSTAISSKSLSKFSFNVSTAKRSKAPPSTKGPRLKMSTTAHPRLPKKRKAASDASELPDHNKKRRTDQRQPQKAALIGPHEAIVNELQRTHHVATLSIISSSPIRQRVEHATAHLVADAPAKPPLVLLYAKTAAQVCKLITVVERCKRTLTDRGKSWHQYNQLFDVPAAVVEPEVVDETVLQGDAAESDAEAFETMSSRISKAVAPPTPPRSIKSLRVYLAMQSVPELAGKLGITVQASDEGAP
ncbi:hypothetical protein CDD81_5259 [Ophiocordyceps australis]|uniref:DNA/RNA-binding protein Alba-like domain-containing protein n=1 Tax=Ophiocordyceps australis TaxID=1399860 RepID=A0A2C5YDW6_9HYPO|nr:hypothetical protein CDD81_5259 [Ophiocordyceps australis]